jgi:hypothetical protein
MTLATTFSDCFSTSKATSFIEMDEAKIKIPRTILINSESIANINSFLSYVNSPDCLLNYQRYSIRLSFSNIEYPHCLRDVAKRNNINAIINSLISKIREYNIDCYDIIFQPLIENVAFSGGIIKKDAFVFIEMVYGAGKTLFRDGQYAYRYLCTDISELETFDNQVLYANLHKGNLIENILNPKYLSQDILRNVAKSIPRIKLINNKLYEFAIVNNNVIFLECKNIIKGSYDNLDKVFTEEGYPVLNLQENCDNVLVLDVPSFEHIDKLTNRSSVYVNSGAILSHMVFYCTQKNISCKFKTSNIKIL